MRNEEGMLQRGLQTADPKDWPEIALRYALPKLSPEQIAQILADCLGLAKATEVRVHLYEISTANEEVRIFKGHW